MRNGLSGLIIALQSRDDVEHCLAPVELVAAFAELPQHMRNMDLTN